MKARNRKPQKRARELSRRQTLRIMGNVVAIAPLASLLGCSEDSTASRESDSTTGGTGASDEAAGSSAGAKAGAGGASTSRGGSSAGGRGGASSASTGLADAGGAGGKGGSTQAGAGGTGQGGATATGASGAGGQGANHSAGQGGSSTRSQAGAPATAGQGGMGGAQSSQGGSSVAWAMGGTKAMTALSSYPDPFEAVSAASCELNCALTLGPCHDDQATEREDVSEGKGGLPMRFALRILDDKCQPITDADVDIWHCDAAGVYSSETADNPAFCTGDDDAALKARFFRGHRMTDKNGVAWFNSCFPGWYPSRAIHVHYTVRRSSRSGDEYLTSQVSFPTELISEVCTQHPEYSARGEPATPNTQDTVFPANSVAKYEVSTRKMPDGALLAWKTIIVRSSLSSAVCSEGAAPPGGPGGMGGPPPSRP